MKELYSLIENKIGMDKVAHFFGIAFIAIVVALLFMKINQGYSTWVNAFIGFFVGAVVAVFKEVFDFFNNRMPDKWDILAGVLGGVIAFLCAGILM